MLIAESFERRACSSVAGETAALMRYPKVFNTDVQSAVGRSFFPTVFLWLLLDERVFEPLKRP